MSPIQQVVETSVYVDDLEGASVGGVDPFATDEQPLLDGFDDLDLILFAVLPAHSEPLS